MEIRRAIDWAMGIGLAAGCAIAGAQPSSPQRPGVQHQGNALAAALLRGDFAAVAATACSPVLARVGGAQALQRQIEASFRVMQQQGRRLVQMRFGAASARFEGGETQFALVPYRSIVRVRDGRVALDSFYLAARNKGADAWCFIDTAALTADNLRELFPNAPAELKLPEQPPATVDREAAK